MADKTMLINSGKRRKSGETATFMPKPAWEAGNGCAIHLFKDGKPLFYDEKGLFAIAIPLCISWAEY